jgi:hypothetical protein
MSANPQLFSILATSLALLHAISANPAQAADHLDGPEEIHGLLVLTVVTADPGAFGYGADVPSEFQGSFQIVLNNPPPASEPVPDGDYEGTFATFELTIGNTSWDASMPHDAPLVRFQGGVAIGVVSTLTDTRPDHPDLMLFMPASPGAWEALDDDGVSNSGSITGTYLFAEGATGVPTLDSWTLVACVILLIAATAFVLPNSVRRRRAD